MAAEPNGRSPPDRAATRGCACSARAAFVWAVGAGRAAAQNVERRRRVCGSITLSRCGARGGREGGAASRPQWLRGDLARDQVGEARVLGARLPEAEGGACRQAPGGLTREGRGRVQAARRPVAGASREERHVQPEPVGRVTDMSRPCPGSVERARAARARAAAARGAW